MNEKEFATQLAVYAVLGLTVYFLISKAIERGKQQLIDATGEVIDTVLTPLAPAANTIIDPTGEGIADFH